MAKKVIDEGTDANDGVRVAEVMTAGAGTEGAVIEDEKGAETEGVVIVIEDAKTATETKDEGEDLMSRDI